MTDVTAPMFFALPIEFEQTGRFNTAAVERYWKESISTAARMPYQIHIKFLSNTTYIASFEQEAQRDQVFTHLDRFLMGKDKLPQYSTEDW